MRNKKHLTTKQIATFKTRLQVIVEEKTKELEAVKNEIISCKSKGNEIPDATLKKQRTIEGIITASKASLEQIEKKVFGYDIHTHAPIPLNILDKSPYIKVSDAKIPRVTCLSGSRPRAYGHV
jgi:hypothetical protein